MPPFKHRRFEQAVTCFEASRLPPLKHQSFKQAVTCFEAARLK